MGQLYSVRGSPSDFEGERSGFAKHPLRSCNLHTTPIANFNKGGNKRRKAKRGSDTGS